MIVVLGIYVGMIDKNFPSLLFVVLVLLLLPTLFAMLIGGGINLGRIFFPLNPVEKAFLSLYTALDYKDPLEGQKYDPVVQEHIRVLMRTVRYELDQPDEVAGILLGEADDLLIDLVDNVKNRLMPASKDGTLTPHTMRQLAKVLAEPTIDGLRKLNIDVETQYDPKEEGVPFETRFSEFFRSQPGHIIQSLVFGFGVAFFTTAVFAVLLQRSFQSVFTEFAGYILGGIFALTAGYLGYLTIQRRGTKREIS